MLDKNKRKKTPVGPENLSSSVPKQGSKLGDNCSIAFPYCMLESYFGDRTTTPSPRGRADRVQVKVGDCVASGWLLFRLGSVCRHTDCRQVCCHHPLDQRRRALGRDRGSRVGRLAARSAVTPQALQAVVLPQGILRGQPRPLALARTARPDRLGPPCKHTRATRSPTTGPHRSPPSTRALWINQYQVHARTSAKAVGAWLIDYGV